MLLSMRLRLNPLNRLLLLRYKALHAERENIVLLTHLDKCLINLIKRAREDGLTSCSVPSTLISPRLQDNLLKQGFTLQSVNNYGRKEIVINWSSTCQITTQTAG